MTISHLGAITAALILTACSTPETYYSLRAEGPLPANSGGIALGVGPVILPDYIDRAELVFQSADHRFQIPYEHRWAGSLRETTTRVLGTNLARVLGTGNLHLHPWDSDTELRYSVQVNIRQFHALSGGDAILEATWRVEGRDSTDPVRRASGNFTEPVVGDGYDAVVAAQSRLLSQLARAIARTLPKD